MKPTVGRQVHYYGPLNADQRGYTGPFAATVVKVNEDESVNLAVLHAVAPSIGSVAMPSARLEDPTRLGEIVEFVREDSAFPIPPDQSPCWCWPPRA
jgi:hypothetical protein